MSGSSSTTQDGCVNCAGLQDISIAPTDDVANAASIFNAEAAQQKLKTMKGTAGEKPRVAKARGRQHHRQMKKLTEKEVEETVQALNFVKENSSERNQAFSV